MSKNVIFTCLAILFIGAANCFAQADSPDDKVKKDTSPGYPVVLGDQTLCYLRDIKGLTGKVYSAQERAKEVSKRIEQMADDPLKSVTSITVFAYEQPITFIAVENEYLMSILD